MTGSRYPLRQITLLFILFIPFLTDIFPTQASPQQEWLAVFVDIDASGMSETKMEVFLVPPLPGKVVRLEDKGVAA